MCHQLAKCSSIGTTVLKWIATSALAVSCWAADWQKVEATEPHMGTLFRVVVYTQDETAARVAMGQAFQRAAQLDQTLSDYRPDSELNTLCQTAYLKPVKVSDDLFRVVAASLRIARQTNGAFDITLGPLTHQWRQAKKVGRLPSPTDVEQARQRTSYKKVQINYRHQTIRLMQENMQLDLGGIAKGYAADQMLEALVAAGFPRVLVAASGDIRVGDAPPGHAGWNVQLNQQTVELRNQAVSTAGPAEQYLEAGGIRYSHILDPRTGIGLTNGRTVSVVAPSGMLADGWDTALCVLGEAGKNRFARNVVAGRAYFFK